MDIKNWRILDKLKGGDRRSVGKANEVVAEVMKEPALFGEVFMGMKSDDPVLRMRAADVIEKVAKVHPEYLRPFKKEIINEIARIEQQEVQWHVALFFTYLELTDQERTSVIEILLSWLEKSKSKIVQANALEALVRIGGQDEQYRDRITRILEKAIATGSPALVARAKKLFGKLKTR
ncbi:MAG: hypothetical protein GX202_09445 [Firmicutes bacterium]|nr:hypothetical protein [Bacillota bacterium]